MMPIINFPYWKQRFSFSFLLQKIRDKGIIWCIYVVCSKIFARMHRYARSILSKIWNIPDSFFCKGKKLPNILYAFYDLALCPATFDIVVFLLLARFEQERIGCSSLHIVIVPGYTGGFRKGDLESYSEDSQKVYDIDSMRWRLNNILIPCCSLISHYSYVTVCALREETMLFQTSLAKHIFPKGYTVRFPKKNYGLYDFIAGTSKAAVVPSIQVSAQARRFIYDWISSRVAERKLITITLRECGYEKDRNSNLKAWAEFARDLDLSVYYPVIVRDTEVALKPLPSELDGLNIFCEPSWNIELRAALYELSYLNMAVVSGTAVICLHNQKSRYLVFKAHIERIKSKFVAHNLALNSQLKFATPFQKIVWEDDRFEVIQREFREMCEKIEKDAK